MSPERPAGAPEDLREQIADMLAHHDECGPGPVSRQEYLDDAEALIMRVRSFDAAGAPGVSGQDYHVHGPRSKPPCTCDCAGCRRGRCSLAPGVSGQEAEGLRRAIDSLAEDGDFDRWMRLAHLDRRNGTTEARDAIRAWFDARASREVQSDPASVSERAAEVSAADLRGEPGTGVCPFHGDYWVDDCERCAPMFSVDAPSDPASGMVRLVDATAYLVEVGQSGAASLLEEKFGEARNGR